MVCRGKIAGPVTDHRSSSHPARCGGETGRPVSLLCSRKAAHGNNRIDTLREVLLHARTFEAKRATLKKRNKCENVGTLRALGESRVRARLGGRVKKVDRHHPQ